VIWEWEGNGNKIQQSWEWEWKLLDGNGRERESKTHSRTPLPQTKPNDLSPVSTTRNRALGCYSACNAAIFYIHHRHSRLPLFHTSAAAPSVVDSSLLLVLQSGIHWLTNSLRNSLDGSGMTSFNGVCKPPVCLLLAFR